MRPFHCLRQSQLILNHKPPSDAINNATAVFYLCVCVCEICLCSWLLSASLFFHENCKPHIYNLLQGANKGSTEARRRQRYANIASRFEAGVINIHFNCTLLLGNYSSLIYLFVFRSSTGTITRSTKDVRTPNCLTV